ncbi:LOW QUALITY PROTEIN: UDP-glycosyltransferase 87A1-like protein [Cinnamomum micranthum f. kanehirae]|uniref:UDP-glycosyltransferase 87A1-like protein n=1 Tax=Cinnamomum micranthum f. kanehirae TaxID=337451 RepID=A0A443NC18_9MAGN|nr:LOW QUALITY PROTEIN: UDP-glycosyltransferase 87A1-like protein [Cinnamomum micranthum f. kanehirae]
MSLWVVSYLCPGHKWMKLQLDEKPVGFLRVARGDATRLQELSGDMGLVVPWCDQLWVVCHSAVGGFLTHCGWNSTMESVYAGVPMLTFPIFWDQIPNAKLMVEDWKVGLRLKQENGQKNLVQGQEIAQTLKRFMDLDRNESRELRRRAREMKESCDRAIEKGGSSETNLRTFFQEIVRRALFRLQLSFEQDKKKEKSFWAFLFRHGTQTMCNEKQRRSNPEQLPTLSATKIFPLSSSFSFFFFSNPQISSNIPTIDLVDMDTTFAVHVVALPSPGRGHINPMMNLCKLLALSDDSLLITFVVTEEWLGFIGSAPTPPNIRLRSIPNVIPFELVRGADLAGFVEAVYTKMEAPFERLLEGLEPKVSCIVADTYLSWAVTVGKRLNLAVASMWPMAPSMFSILYHFDLFNSNGHFPIDELSGISSIRLADLPFVSAKKGEAISDRVLGAISFSTESQCLLFTSFHGLENHVIDNLRTKFRIPIYHVGPTIPYMTLQDMPPNAVEHPKADHLDWLDLQPKSSVLYVSFGSFLSVSGPQMDEILNGLQASGVRFLWVARGDATRFQEVSNMGLVVPWCDQLRVLCHSSVGGFLTHCGWNSTMESVYAGVPMLTFPLLWDQITNAKLIVEDWKVGLRLKQEFGEKNVVQRQEIAQTVKRFMDLDGDESRELRRRAREMKEICERAIKKGGSSETNLSAFVKEIVQGHKNQSS